MRVDGVRLFARWMKTRLPFKYGIATLTALPHLLVQVEIADQDTAAIGQAADGLAPKWFTKDPGSRPEDDIAEMTTVIRHAAKTAEGARFDSPFDAWRSLADEQASWATAAGYPPLLRHFGVSLVERALIQAWCRLRGESFSAAVLGNTLRIDLGAVHGEIRGLEPIDLLPSAPSENVAVRHTVGLGDPLRKRDAAAPDDGLPVTLLENIAEYGLRYLKVKIRGDLAWDRERLREVASVIDTAESAGYTGGESVRITVDGNEQFNSIAEFRDHYQNLRSDSEVAGLLERLIFVEQPVKRASAFDDRESVDWSDGPTVIIDESDGAPEDLETALDRGYRGTSHKNCKGVIKGIAHACLLEKRNRESQASFILSGEDLANVGPLALLQDLHALSVLGVDHAERNGHHYFRGLSMWSHGLQDEVLRIHPELYQPHPAGFAALTPRLGALSLTGLRNTAFGPNLVIPESELTEVTDETPADLSALR